MSKEKNKKTFKDELKESILEELKDLKELFPSDEGANDPKNPEDNNQGGGEAGLSEEEISELKEELKKEIAEELKNDILKSAKSEVKKLAKTKLPKTAPVKVITDLNDE